MDFREKLKASAEKRRSLLSIGLDPDPALTPIRDVRSFLSRIVEATSDIACAYKLNLAFYEAMGIKGLRILENVMSKIPEDVVKIGDGKRGDIGVSSKKYAEALFDVFGFDAVTVSPYMGKDSLEPFFEFSDRGVFVLVRTTNRGAADFQELYADGKPLYLVVAERVRGWNEEYGNLGVVVGATFPEGIRRVREVCPDMPFLVPGVGAQGGNLEEAVRASIGGPFIISSSRSILYASGGRDFAEASRREAIKLRDRINAVIGGGGGL